MYIAAFRRAMQQIGLGPLYDALIASEGAIVIGPPVVVTSPITVTYVAPNGDDATAARGNISKPFLTIQAALLAIVSGDVIDIAPAGPPGTRYAENLVVPAALLEVTLRGPAEISPATGVALTYTPTGARAALNLDTITIETRDPNPAINALAVTGTAVVGTASVGIKDSTIGRSRFVDMLTIDIFGTQTLGPPVFVNNGDVTVRNSITQGGRATVTYDGTVATRVRGTHLFKVCTLRAGLELVGEPEFVSDQATRIEGGIDATALGALAGVMPDITVHGSCLGPCVFTFAPSVGVPFNVLDLTGASFSDPVTIATTAVDAQPAQVTADNTVFRDTVTIGESVELEASNASILGTLVGVASGASNRSILTPTITAVPAPPVGALAVAISPAMLDTNYQVIFEARDVASPAFYLLSKTLTGYTFECVPSLLSASGSVSTTVTRGP